jgi:DNA-binding MarR family transcriptional regulator
MPKNDMDSEGCVADGRAMAWSSAKNASQAEGIGRARIPRSFAGRTISPDGLALPRRIGETGSMTIRSAMDSRAESSLIALRRILRATEENMRLLARATGLTTPQIMVLQIVEDAGEATPKQIATRAGIAPATATALIEKLVQRGYVRRQRGQTDRRQFWVSLTSEGAQALHDAPDPLHQQFTERFARLPDWEQAMIVAALERVAGLVSAAPSSDTRVLHVTPVAQGESAPGEDGPGPA